MKTFLLTAAKTGVPFGLVMGVVYANRGRGAIVMGIVMGIAFGCAMAGFVAWQHTRAAKLVAAYESEGVIHHGPANLGAAGGWLVLTKQRLVFEPHKLNVGAKRMELQVADIAGVREGDGVVANKIAIATRDGKTVQLVVGKRAEWIAKLPGVKQAS